MGKSMQNANVIRDLVDSYKLEDVLGFRLCQKGRVRN